MKIGPQSVQAWLVFSLTLIAIAVVLGWAFSKDPLDPGVKELLILIIGIMGGVLTSYKSELPTGSMVKTETATIETTEQPNDGQEP